MVDPNPVLSKLQQKEIANARKAEQEKRRLERESRAKKTEALTRPQSKNFEIVLIQKDHQGNPKGVKTFTSDDSTAIADFYERESYKGVSPKKYHTRAADSKEAEKVMERMNLESIVKELKIIKEESLDTKQN